MSAIIEEVVGKPTTGKSSSHRRVSVKTYEGGWQVHLGVHWNEKGNARASIMLETDEAQELIEALQGAVGRAELSKLQLPGSDESQ